MGFFEFLYGKTQYKVSLSSVARMLKISEISIVAILREAGFNISNMPFVKLDERHLEILSVKYIDAIKNYHSSSIKNYYNLNFYDQEQTRRFFSKFIQNRFFWHFSYADITSETFLNSKLNSNSIKEFFYKIIEEIEFEELYGHKSYRLQISTSSDYQFNKFLHKIKLKISNSFNDIKSKLISILTTYQYYVFSDDEEHIAKANLEFCFSALRNVLREALININYLKQQIQWKKLNYLYKK